MAEEQGGFLGRWARRKTDVLQGKPVADPVVAAKDVLPEASTDQISPVDPDAAPEPPALSLEDIKLLSKDSDFKPFMAQNVSADVRNAAMKKLFADPHFNIMDGLDIYIDDYSKSDPIPEAMLRAMTSSQFLKLFDDEEDKDKKEDVATRETANNTPDQTVAQSSDDHHHAEPDSATQENISQPESFIDPVAGLKDHDHSHLRLQPDHAAPAPKTGNGT